MRIGDQVLYKGQLCTIGDIGHDDLESKAFLLEIGKWVYMDLLESAQPYLNEQEMRKLLGVSDEV